MKSRSLFLKLSISILFTIVLFEFLLRYFWMLPVTAKGAYLCRHDFADHSHYAHGTGRMRTGEFNIVLRMNNIGMRDDEVEIPKPGGRKRIILLGDSFMEGWGNERGDIFTDRLEGELKSHDTGIEVVAAGVASWSPLAELAWLKHEGLALEPDIVLLGIDATDPAGDSFYARRLVRDSEGHPDFIERGRRRWDFPKPVHEFLAAHSYIYRYADRILTKKFPLSEWDYGFWAEGNDVWAPLRSDSELPEPAYSSYWTHTREALRELKRVCDARSIPLLIFMYPTGVETDSSAWLTGRNTADFGPGLIAPRRFDFMEKMALEEGLPYFSLLETFQSHNEPAKLFFPYDGHWSREGHHFAAKAMADEMIRRQMLDL